MHPTHVVVDTVDGYVFARDRTGELFSGATAQAFADHRNSGDGLTYRVFKLDLVVPDKPMIKLWQTAGCGRYHATPSCSGAGSRQRMVETCATESELVALWESHIRANTDPSGDLCRCAWSKIPGHTLNKMDIERYGHVASWNRKRPPLHPSHTVDGPADCDRCQLLRDNAGWMGLDTP